MVRRQRRICWYRTPRTWLDLRVVPRRGSPCSGSETSGSTCLCQSPPRGVNFHRSSPRFFEGVDLPPRVRAGEQQNGSCNGRRYPCCRRGGPQVCGEHSCGRTGDLPGVIYHDFDLSFPHRDRRKVEPIRSGRLNLGQLRVPHTERWSEWESCWQRRSQCFGLCSDIVLGYFRVAVLALL